LISVNYHYTGTPNGDIRTVSNSNILAINRPSTKQTQIKGNRICFVIHLQGVWQWSDRVFGGSFFHEIEFNGLCESG